jgi:hypothetical protein
VQELAQHFPPEEKRLRETWGRREGGREGGRKEVGNRGEGRKAREGGREEQETGERD